MCCMTHFVLLLAAGSTMSTSTIAVSIVLRRRGYQQLRREITEIRKSLDRTLQLNASSYQGRNY